MAEKDVSLEEIKKILSEHKVDLSKIGDKKTQAEYQNDLKRALELLKSKYIKDKENYIGDYNAVISVMSKIGIGEEDACFKSLIEEFMPDGFEDFKKSQKEGKNVSLDEVKKILLENNADLSKIGDRKTQAEYQNDLKRALELLKSKYVKGKENYIGDYNAVISVMSEIGIREEDACFKSLIETFMPDDFEKSLTEERNKKAQQKEEEHQSETEIAEVTETQQEEHKNEIIPTENQEQNSEKNQGESEITETQEETKPQQEEHKNDVVPVENSEQNEEEHQSEAKEQEIEENEQPKLRGKTVAEEYKNAIEMCKKINKLADKIELAIDNGERVNHIASILVSGGVKIIGDVSVLTGTTVKVTIKGVKNLIGKRFKPNKKTKEKMKKFKKEARSRGKNKENEIEQDKAQEILDKTKDKVDSIREATMDRFEQRKLEYLKVLYPELQENEILELGKLFDLKSISESEKLTGKDNRDFLKLLKKYNNYVGEINELIKLDSDIDYRISEEARIENELASKDGDIHNEALLKFCYAVDLDVSAYNLQIPIEEIQAEVDKISEKEIFEGKDKVTVKEKMKKGNLIRLANNVINSLETKSKDSKDKNESPISEMLNKQQERTIKVIIDGTEMLMSKEDLDVATKSMEKFLHSQDQDKQEQSDR